ncbi:50S ribosomal protein L25/general stress protein Ctc [Gordonia hongkongensis]|jgi:large subunit ribosomal protein L25|uniref:Large ribosomal subunit protein bL25 n=1 Tax=Gordonia hongkongensis TaxID=1701090 RepID=A0AAX3TAU1_9ACTN|nr:MULTISPECIES: 50S ribosomal protein L25/general stress protein Ctc [Gordonia]QIK48871.1 50S ribosomal protein L25/general stress protein Ctc [Gordonia terrae]MBN0972629.1 50S ribosomal protein L25/general stress protein Ctc [Gordonia sp. BP-119]MBN0981505.1 50S ribosomal protein L25/general stress protein Ctc [Gordonia sp. BP-94]OCH81092.1 50S ribosomal protein L25/general stress protein Ctc [Gordonia sp. UCD-TK1]WFP26225.1 50S ribosomal protein L25/general stress protein Ctc [Gordonia hong
MATQTSKLSVSTRTEKGKGAARRARREGKVPAVLYGHGTDPQHLHLPAREFAAILRNSGLNAVIDLDIEGSSQLALTKQVDVHPIRNYIEHADLLIVRRGEKVTVEIAIIVEGDAAPGTLVVQDASVVEVEADALSIPEQIVVSVEGAEIGLSVHASDLDLPEGVTLTADPETLIVSVTEAQLAATESDADGSADAAAEGDAEGEATEEAAAESE